ncbi:MAG: zinc ribbon domain-containing protein [Christensenellales bacterium]|jgi:predicted amidophosphoribosyltransferase
MFICKNCGAKVGPGDAFCKRCGKDVVENYEAVCPKCSTHNIGGSAFCVRCGGALSQLRKPVCPSCGKINFPGAKFCRCCGGLIPVSSETHSQAQVEEDIKGKKAAAKQEEDRIARLEAVLNEKVKRFNEYKDKYRRYDTPAMRKLKKLAKDCREQSKIEGEPYGNSLSEAEIEAAAFVCPVCGKVNDRLSQYCTRCGRSKAKMARLALEGKIPSFRDAVPVSVEPISLKDGEPDYIDKPMLDLDVKIEEENLHTVSDDFDMFAEEDDIAAAAETAVAPAAPVAPAPAQAAEAVQYPQEMPQFSGGYYPPPQYGFAGQAAVGTRILMSAGFQGAEPGEPYQMPPIIQPVTFVPFVSTDQPLWQIDSPDADEAKRVMKE